MLYNFNPFVPSDLYVRFHHLGSMRKMHDKVTQDNFRLEVDFVFSPCFFL